MGSGIIPICNDIQNIAYTNELSEIGGKGVRKKNIGVI